MVICVPRDKCIPAACATNIDASGVSAAVTYLAQAVISKAFTPNSITSDAPSTVTFTLGNANSITVSLFSPANTLAALLANTFPEAQHKEVGILMYAALVLLGITLVVNMIGAFILQRASAGLEGAK